jgi:cytosine/adenosine deaminase-related metal-dependent hydrolase
MLEYAQRLAHRARNLWPRNEGESTGRALFDGALSGGANALGQPNPGLCTGSSADFFTLAANDPVLAGRKEDTILDSWVFAGAGIDAVWRRGKKLVSAGRHCAHESVVARYGEVLRRLMAA